MVKRESWRTFRSDAGERVGCLSVVNQQLSKEGLLRVVPLNPLVSEAHAPPQTSRSSFYQASRLKQKELLEAAEVR